MKKKSISILFLQETHDKNKQCIEQLKKTLKMQIYVCKGSKLARGVMTCITKNDDINIVNVVHNDSDGNMLIVNCLIESYHLLLINYYAPSKPAE